MPYALFYQDAKLSKAYPTEADVWTLARKSGLVVDAVSEEEKSAPRPVLDNDYEIRPCQLDPNEDPNDPRLAKPLSGAPPFGIGWYHRAYDVDCATSGTRSARPRTSSSLTPSATAYTR